MAHNLDLRVVAEGIESEAVRRQLVRLGCDLLQGYHVSRPVSADMASGLLHRAVEKPARLRRMA